MSKIIFNKSAKNILSYFISVVILTIFIMPFLVQAQQNDGRVRAPEQNTTSNTPQPNTTANTPPAVKMDFKIDNPFKQDTIQDLISTIVNDILMPIGGVLAVLMIMWAGFLYVTAGGNPAKIETAHKALLWAAIGAAILLGAWVISTAITATINSLKAP